MATVDATPMVVLWFGITNKQRRTSNGWGVVLQAGMSTKGNTCTHDVGLALSREWALIV